MKNIFSRSPSLFNIPATCSFVDALVTGLITLSDGRPEALAEITLFLPSRRARRAVQDAFLRHSKGSALLLPKLTALGDIDGEDMFQEAETLTSLDIEPAINDQQQLLLMTKLVARASPGIGRDKSSLAQNLGLARALIHTLDAMESDGISLKQLQNLVPQPLAHHWQKIMGLLEILSGEWPNILNARGVILPTERRNKLLRALAKKWAAHPPKGIVLAAGSTGSLPATRELLHVIARLPRGGVILPGLDFEMDDESWDAIDDNHPQAMLKNLLAAMSVARAEVEPWLLTPELQKITQGKAERFQILSDALAPSLCLNKWRQLSKNHSSKALDGLCQINCPGLREEAGVIALMMRETLETPGKTVALVTRDRRLARRVASELQRWVLEVEDSAGVPLIDTPVGSFLQLIVEAASEEFAPVSLLALVKHPFCHAGHDRADVLAEIRLFEMESLRGPRPPSGLKFLIKMSKASDKPLPVIQKLFALLKPLESAFNKKSLNLDSLITNHLKVAEKLAHAPGQQSDPSPLWSGEAGKVAVEFCRDLQSASSVMGRITVADYPAFFREMMSDFVVRKSFGTHPRLFIWGPLEARLQHTDRMILGGMNEGSWPPAPAIDPWMSRPMRKEIGLSGPERRIGQAAHDFMSAVSANDVIITRSLRIDGTPSIPSRWLKRIEALAHPLVGGDMPWLSWQALLDRAEHHTPTPPPDPKPPVAARPKTFSVTQIEGWLRDPYHLYAKKILKLNPQDPLNMPPDAAEKGSLFHDILDEFVKNTSEEKDLTSVDKLLETGRSFFSRHIDRPGVWAFWWPRFETIARAFVDIQEDRAEGKRILATEIKGKTRFGNNGEYTLTARADRIDLVCDDKTIEIIDYKTGIVPSLSMVRAGHACQLPLEGWILENGEFEFIKPQKLSALSYWKLGGSSSAIKITVIDKDLENLVQQAGEQLKTLVAKFNDVQTPYLSKPRPKLRSYEDYDQLARVKEWQNEPFSIEAKPSPVAAEKVEK